MTIDPRLEVRRQRVAENRAQRNAGRLVAWLLTAALIGVGVWLVFSPYFSVAHVDVSGVSKSDTNSILVAEGLNVGRPMVFLDIEATEAALASDPWVAEASVVRHWPTVVEVTVVERTPIAWVLDEEGWSRRDIEASPVPSDTEPDGDLATIRLPGVARADQGDSNLVGALEFVAAVGEAIPGLEVQVVQGELWAKAGDHQVRLGRPIEMSDKAEVLVAMLDQELPADAVLILVAPSNPSYDVPRGSENEDQGDDDN